MNLAIHLLGATMTRPSGRAAIVAHFPDDWDPAHADQLAQFNTILQQLPDLDIQLVGAAGAEAVELWDANDTCRWSHAGPMSASKVDELVGAIATLGDSPSTRLTPSRREFVASVLGSALLVAARPMVAKAERLAGVQPVATALPAAQHVTLNINGRSVSLDIEPRVTLLDALREYAGLTGTKKGCDHGQCGACTVHIDGRRELSCLTFAVMHQNARITTVEGLANGDTLHPMQAAFIKHDGFQCGYCTPGQLMSATALLHEPCGSADTDVRECMSGNICRCGAYPGIVAAVQEVRATSRG